MDSLNNLLSNLTSSTGSSPDKPKNKDTLSNVSSQNTNIDTNIKGMFTSLDIKNTNSQIDTERARMEMLLRAYQDDMKEEAEAPQNTIQSRNAYYESVYQNSASQLELYYNTEAIPLWQSLTQEKNKLIMSLNESIYFLQSQGVYLESLQTGSLDPVAGVTATAPEIDTPLRKSGFYRESDAMITMWTAIVNCILFTYGCILLFHFRNSLLEPTVLLTITLTFMSVFALDFILKLVFYIPEKIIGYLGWGYTPTDLSTWWYLWIPASLIAIYIIISSLL
jgi:hypothetical protein